MESFDIPTVLPVDSPWADLPASSPAAPAALSATGAAAEVVAVVLPTPAPVESAQIGNSSSSSGNANFLLPAWTNGTAHEDVGGGHASLRGSLTAMDAAPAVAARMTARRSGPDNPVFLPLPSPAPANPMELPVMMTNSPVEVGVGSAVDVRTGVAAGVGASAALPREALTVAVASAARDGEPTLLTAVTPAEARLPPKPRRTRVSREWQGLRGAPQQQQQPRLAPGQAGRLLHPCDLASGSGTGPTSPQAGVAAAVATAREPARDSPGMPDQPHNSGGGASGVCVPLTAALVAAVGAGVPAAMEKGSWHRPGPPPACDGVRGGWDAAAPANSSSSLLSPSSMAQAVRRYRAPADPGPAPPPHHADPWSASAGAPVSVRRPGLSPPGLREIALDAGGVRAGRATAPGMSDTLGDSLTVTPMPHFLPLGSSTSALEMPHFPSASAASALVRRGAAPAQPARPHRVCRSPAEPQAAFPLGLTPAPAPVVAPCALSATPHPALPSGYDTRTVSSPGCEAETTTTGSSASAAAALFLGRADWSAAPVDSSLTASTASKRQPHAQYYHQAPPFHAQPSARRWDPTAPDTASPMGEGSAEGAAVHDSDDHRGDEHVPHSGGESDGFWGSSSSALLRSYHRAFSSVASEDVRRTLVQGMCIGCGGFVPFPVSGTLPGVDRGEGGVSAGPVRGPPPAGPVPPAHPQRATQPHIQRWAVPPSGGVPRGGRDGSEASGAYPSRRTGVPGLAGGTAEAAGGHAGAAAGPLGTGAHDHPHNHPGSLPGPVVVSVSGPYEPRGVPGTEAAHPSSFIAEAEASGTAEEEGEGGGAGRATLEPPPAPPADRGPPLSWSDAAASLHSTSDGSMLSFSEVQRQHLRDLWATLANAPRAGAAPHRAGALDPGDGLAGRPAGSSVASVSPSTRSNPTTVDAAMARPPRREHGHGGGGGLAWTAPQPHCWLSQRPPRRHASADNDASQACTDAAPPLGPHEALSGFLLSASSAHAAAVEAGRLGSPTAGNDPFGSSASPSVMIAAGERGALAGHSASSSFAAALASLHTLMPAGYAGGIRGAAASWSLMDSRTRSLAAPLVAGASISTASSTARGVYHGPGALSDGEGVLSLGPRSRTRALPNGAVLVCASEGGDGEAVYRTSSQGTLFRPYSPTRPPPLSFAYLSPPSNLNLSRSPADGGWAIAAPRAGRPPAPPPPHGGDGWLTPAGSELSTLARMPDAVSQLPVLDPLLFLTGSRSDAPSCTGRTPHAAVPDNPSESAALLGDRGRAQCAAAPPTSVTVQGVNTRSPSPPPEPHTATAASGPSGANERTYPPRHPAGPVPWSDPASTSASRSSWGLGGSRRGDSDRRGSEDRARDRWGTLPSGHAAQSCRSIQCPSEPTHTAGSAEAGEEPPAALAAPAEDDRQTRAQRTRQGATAGSSGRSTTAAPTAQCVPAFVPPVAVGALLDMAEDRLRREPVRIVPVLGRPSRRPHRQWRGAQQPPPTTANGLLGRHGWSGGAGGDQRRHPQHEDAAGAAAHSTRHSASVAGEHAVGPLSHSVGSAVSRASIGTSAGLGTERRDARDGPLVESALSISSLGKCGP